MNNIDLIITLTQHERDANNVTIAFTMGLKAAEDGYDVELVLLSDAVHLVEEGYADKIDIGEPFAALKNVSFSLDEGEVLGIVGESGSGKTTLSEIAGGLRKPTYGSVLFQGKDIGGMKKEEWRE